MTAVHVVLGAATLAVFAACSALGAWRWHRVEQSRWFWLLLRAGQALVIVEAALGGVLLLAGERPSSGLHYLYGLLPIVVSFAAEQLRIASAQSVLEARGHTSAADVGRLPEAQQRSVVVAILQRELGVMTLASLAVLGLLLRAMFAV